jgi:hypothetical protein
MRAAAAVAGLVLAAVLAIARPAAATPLPIVLEKDGITLKAAAGLDDVASRLIAASPPHLAAIAEDQPDLPAPRRVEIRVVGDAADMQSVAPGGRTVPAWAAGVAFPDLGIVIVATRRASQILDIDEVLHHELAHLALGAALGNRAPRWLHEGFAYQHSAEWSWDRTETLAGMAWGNNIIPLEQLDHSFPAQELPVSLAYAESFDFVGYLSRRGRWEDKDDDGDRWPFRKFLGLVGHGSTIDAAAVKAFGRPIQDLFREWREDLSRRFVLLPAGVFAALIWIVSALLLALAFLRRRRMRLRRYAQWDAEEAEAEARRAAWLATVPGLDGFDDDGFDDGDRGTAPRLPN